MKILAFDTSGLSLTAALVENDIIVSEETSLTRETHARHIMPVLEGILYSAGINLSAVDMIAVSRGPGSFTGLRIGLGVAKGLSYALTLPVVGVSTLDALAWPLRKALKRVFVLMDARRGEVYSASYLFCEGRISEKTDEVVCSPEQAIMGAEDGDVFCGSGASVYFERIEGVLGKKIFPVNPDSVVRASDIALIAAEYVQLNICADASSIVPVYLRRSEAEINYEVRNPSV